jgi:hypothetical protein
LPHVEASVGVDTHVSDKARRGSLDGCIARVAHALIAWLRIGQNVRRR